MRDVHSVPMHFPCSVCEYSTENDAELKVHIQTKHKATKVQITLEDQKIIKCEKCDFKCILNIQMKKHILKKHFNISKYRCKECEFETNFIADIWEHALNQHPDTSSQFYQSQTEKKIRTANAKY